jgi:hypothetical protein
MQHLQGLYPLSLFVGEPNPVTILPGQFAPLFVHVVTEGDQDVPWILPARPSAKLRPHARG